MLLPSVITTIFMTMNDIANNIWNKKQVFFLYAAFRMIEEGSKRGKAAVEKRQLFMEMSEFAFLLFTLV